MSSGDVARAMGVDVRTVKRWAEPNGAYRGRVCPHERVKGRNGGNDAGEVLRFNLDEVRAWCEAQGVGKARSLEDRDRNEHGPVVYTVTGEVVGPRAKVGGGLGGRGPRPDERDSQISPADAVQHAPSAIGPNPSTPALLPGDDRAAVRAQIEALGSVVHELQVAIAAMKREGKAEGLSTAQLQQAVTAAQKVSQEVRQLDAQDLAMRRERGDLVDKGSAEVVIRRATEGMITSIETLRQEVCDALLAIGCRIEGMTDEAFERCVYAKLEPVFESARRRVADELSTLGETRPEREAA